MNKIKAITILSIFLLMLSFSNLFAASKYDVDTGEISNRQNNDSLVQLAQADTSSQNMNDNSSDMNDELSDMDDDLFGDDFADEMEELEKPHETIADPLEPFNRAMFHFLKLLPHLLPRTFHRFLR